MSTENLVEFEDYVAAVGRRKKLILVTVAAFVLLGAVYSVLSTKQYTAESRVSVTPVFDPSSAALSEVNIDTERGIARSSAVAAIAQNILGSQTDPTDLLDRLAVDPVGESTILAFRYTHTDPEAAYRGANAFARAYLDFRQDEADSATRQARDQIQSQRAAEVEDRNRVESDLAGLEPGTPEYSELAGQAQEIDGAIARLDRQLLDISADSQGDPGTIIDEAEVPTSPSTPGLPMHVAGAAVLGLVLALTATFVLERKNLGARGAAAAAAGAAPAPEPPAPVTAPALPLPSEVERPRSLESALPVASTPAPAPAPRPDPEPAVAPPVTPAAAPTRAKRPVAALPAAEPAPTAPRPAPAAAPTPTAATSPRPASVPAPAPAPTPAPAPPPVVAAPPAAVAPVTPPTPPAPADRRRRRDPSQALAGLQVELLGNVPRLSNDAGEAAFDAVALGGPSGEALRRLHATLWPRLEQHGARVVFVTSAIERGVTVGLAGGLAATAALAGQDALLIAGDLHQPRLHDRLELGNDQGLAEVLSGQRPMNQVLQGWAGIENLCVVTAGRPGPDPSSLVSADRLAAQLRSVRDEFQLIVIEGPPVGETADATVMASVSDAVILAVDPRHSAEHELGGAVSRLRLAKAPVLGAVVVEARAPRTGLPVAVAAAPSRG